jgi:hypothetical protein
MIDVIKIDVPTFIRLMELSREDIKNDMDIHDVAEIVTKISQERVVTMADYDSIVGFMAHQGNDTEEPEHDELDTIKRLGGVN